VIGRGPSNKLRQSILIGIVQVRFFAEPFDEDFDGLIQELFVFRVADVVLNLE